MSEEWDFYFCTVDEKLASIFCDVGIRKEAPLPGVDDLTWLRLQMRQPRPDGLSSREEFERLCEIDDALQAAASNITPPIEYVGRNTCDGCRDYYFYSSNGQLAESSLSMAMVPFTEYEFETRSRVDAEWACYLNFLYPSPRQWQTIKNERVRRALEEHGDKHEIVRDVTHWIYFRSANDRERYVDHISAGGFRVVDKAIDADGERPFGLMISKESSMDSDAINEVTLELFDLAANFEAAYDGWETSVEEGEVRPQQAEPSQPQV